MAIRPAIFKWRQTEPQLIFVRCAGISDTRFPCAMLKSCLGNVAEHSLFSLQFSYPVHGCSDVMSFGHRIVVSS